MDFKTCLIVDDSRIIRKVARRIVEGLDYEVDEAADGAEAAAAASTTTTVVVRSLLALFHTLPPGERVVSVSRVEETGENGPEEE